MIIIHVIQFTKFNRNIWKLFISNSSIGTVINLYHSGVYVRRSMCFVARRCAMCHGNNVVREPKSFRDSFFPFSKSNDAFSYSTFSVPLRKPETPLRMSAHEWHISVPCNCCRNVSYSSSILNIYVFSWSCCVIRTRFGWTASRIIT